ncbi:MAG: N-acetylmannosamine-6-phosphate 2-epimerase [Acholeplasmataceae bacterium]|nr:N-acetylmannosamine-6-phosphate 2-epimerase [Acholeplasmataceae bacterium]
MIKQLKGKLIVSCQALEGEPLYGSHIMRKMALAAKEGGASAIRANGVEDIKAIKEETNLPIIGLIKRDYPNCDVYITPTVKEIKELIGSGCEIIAMDATDRCHPDGVSLKGKVDLIHEAGLLAMADISTENEAIEAEKIGFDLVSTTLSGYTPYSKQQEKPDVELVGTLVKKLSIPVIAEGRITTIEDFKAVKAKKPHAIVVGTAITRPQTITKRFVDAL